MSVDRVAGWLLVLPLLVVPGWSVARVATGLRRGDWCRPGWFGQLAWASFLLLALAWLTGFLAGGLQWGKTCRYGRHQPFDEAYYQSHRADYFRLFPLSRHCNAGYDLVPAWVNPAVLASFLLFLVGLAGLAGTVLHRSVQRRTVLRRTVPRRRAPQGKANSR